MVKKQKTNKLYPAFAALALSGMLVVFSCSPNGSEVDPPTPVNDSVIYANAVGATANDGTDDTQAFQRAVDSIAKRGGGTVKAKPGTYIIDPVKSISMKSNVTLDLEDASRVLQAMAVDTGRYNIIRVWETTNVKIKGGLIIGDLFKHTGPTCTGSCEHGYGIIILGNEKTRVEGSYIKHCWGDGIVIAGRNGKRAYDTHIEKAVCDSNRRQGLTIGGGAALVRITKSDFINTGQYKGTKPMDGIDIEPDCGLAEDIVIQECYFDKNGFIGIPNMGANAVEMNAVKTDTRIAACADKGGAPIIRTVTVQNNIMKNSNYPGYVQRSENVVFNNNKFYGIRFPTLGGASSCTDCTLSPNEIVEKYQAPQ